jgi:hypothetical protein
VKARAFLFGAEKHLKKHKIQRSKNTKKVRGNKNE